jgi:membrane-associated protease RseP (regulator of RpoE activity)
LSNDTFPAQAPSTDFRTPAPPLDAGRRRFQNRVGLHVALFALTFLTTTLAGAQHYWGYLSELLRRTPPVEPSLLLNGLWYSGTILGILGAHELGHYLYCRYYNIDSSLPYFLPLPPFIFLTGTLGAVIRIREPFRTKTELFDVGIAGPIAGLVVLLPALFYGLSLSTIVPEPTQGVVIYMGEPLLFQWATALVIGPIPAGSTVNMHPIVLACWFGMFATALNLIPFGQFDGGHIVYAIFGDRVARYVSALAVIVPAALIVVSWGWLLPTTLMALMWRIIGLGHPSPFNPYEPLSRSRKAFALVALVAFIVCFTPAPLWIEELGAATH